MFHLGWFTNFAPQGWGAPSSGHGYDWRKPDLYVDAVRAMERAHFDLVLLEDSDMVPDVYGGSTEVYLKHALEAPKLDPLPFVPTLAAATEHVGIIATAVTTFYPPYLLARLFSTLDHMSGGRVGWNIVTGTNNRAAQNYGLDQHYEHDLRYDMAEEYVEVVEALWNSWEPDAVVRDEANGVFTDHTKVHTIDYEGRYHRSRGPLNIPRSPQGKPVLAQAGGSPRGRRFAASHAEVIVAAVNTVEEMKTYRSEVRDQMVLAGRDPDSCKILFAITPIIADTVEEATQIERAKFAADRANPEAILAELSVFSNIDFAQFDLDAPLPELTTNGAKSTLALFQGHGDMTLREIAARHAGVGNVPFVGTAETVADRMGEVMEEAGGDGYLIAGPLTPRYVSRIADDLAPALERRGLTRDSYGHTLFRDNLLDF